MSHPTPVEPTVKSIAWPFHVTDSSSRDAPAFETWKCRRVELITDVLNLQSRAAILRLGAKQEGILRKHLISPTGRNRDTVIYSITDDEWPEVRTRLQTRLE